MWYLLFSVDMCFIIFLCKYFVFFVVIIVNSNDSLLFFKFQIPRVNFWSIGIQLNFVRLLCIPSCCCSCLSAPGVIFSVVWCVLYMQRHLQIKIFIYSFLICINLYSFLQWLAGLPVDAKSESEGHPCWAPDHGRHPISFSVVNLTIVYNGYQLRSFCIPNLLRAFIMNDW